MKDNKRPDVFHDGSILDRRSNCCKGQTLINTYLQMSDVLNIKMKQHTVRRNPAGIGSDAFGWQESKAIVQKLSFIPEGICVHNCTLNSLVFPTSRAISCRGTSAARTIVVIKVLLFESSEYNRERMIIWTKQWIMPNRKKARDILLSVIRWY